MINEIAPIEAPTNEYDYETERNKPMPNKIHGAVQHNISVLLDKYSDRFLFATETSLDTIPPQVSSFPWKRFLSAWSDTRSKSVES